MKSIHELLEIAIARDASDLLIKAGAHPAIRVDGGIQALSDIEKLTPYDARELAYSVIFSASRDYLLQYPEDEGADHTQEMADAEDRMRELHRMQELDLVFTIPKLARVRANLYMQRGTMGAALRIIPLEAGTIDSLNLPGCLKEIAMQPHGLIIITGPTGSGKTTTMAAVIEEINRRRPCNIFTIEEPIEYVFADQRSMIHQREVNSDTASFNAALRSVMRQTPDVIAIGEMRDAETMDVAMTASEIGHLVITTLHTVSAATTVDRIVNSFPQHLKEQVTTQLAASLLCITSQRLIRRADGKGRIPAVEVMINSPTVRKQIEEGASHELYAAIREGSHYGMNTMNQALDKLYHDGTITYDEAMQYAGNATELRQMLRRS